MQVPEAQQRGLAERQAAGGQPSPKAAGAKSPLQPLAGAVGVASCAVAGAEPGCPAVAATGNPSTPFRQSNASCEIYRYASYKRIAIAWDRVASAALTNCNESLRSYI